MTTRLSGSKYLSHRVNLINLLAVFLIVMLSACLNSNSTYGSNTEPLLTYPLNDYAKFWNEKNSDPRYYKGLSMDERIACQRTIEEVYWQHRIWPKDNNALKPVLQDELPYSALVQKVEDYMQKSNALASYWNQQVTAAQLQAEMDRIAKNTKSPQVLLELWKAL